MKAIVCPRYGPAEVLQLREVEKPSPNDDEVLVKVSAASVNSADVHMLRGPPFLARLVLSFFPLDIGLRGPKHQILGADIAGHVESAGAHVTMFRPGDEVFGVRAPGSGGFAEYACAREKGLALKPANLSFDESAAVPVAATTALQGLRDKGLIQPEQKVLVNGASGGVGTFAVQIAKSYGTEVTGVCSSRNLDMVRSIGADQVIDYTREDFTRNGQQYDLIFDAVGNRSLSDYKRALKPNGICAIAGVTDMSHLFQHMVMGPLRSKAGKGRVGSMGMARVNQTDLVFLKELMETGKIRPVIDKTFPLSETAQAIRHLEGKGHAPGHARGKVIISMEQDIGPLATVQSSPALAGIPS